MAAVDAGEFDGDEDHVRADEAEGNAGGDDDSEDGDYGLCDDDDDDDE